MSSFSPIKCPVALCTHKIKFRTMQGLKGHLNCHLEGKKGFKKWEVEPRTTFLNSLLLTVCAGCGKISGNGPKNNLESMHRNCFIKVKEERKEEVKGNEKTEKSSTFTSPPASNGHMIFPPIPQTAPEDGKKYPQFDLTASKTSLMDIAQSNVRTIICVPSTHQAEFDECADYALDVILENPLNPERWKPFLALPRAVLVNDGLSGKSKKRLRDSNLTARAKRFMEGEWEELLAENVEISEKGNRCSQVPTETSKEKRWTRMTFEGKQSSVLREMMSTGICEDTSETVKEAESKFPKRHEEVEEPVFTANFEPPVFTPSEVEAEARKMRHRSAGSTKISMEMTLGWMRSTHRPILREKVTRVVNLIAAGKAPIELATELGLPLTLLKKLPRGIRPIGVPFGFEGLVTRLLTAREKEAISTEFLPLQQALTARGAEVTAHALRCWIEANAQNPRARLLALDFRNMFNELFRREFLPMLLKRFPSIAAYAYWAYKNVRKMFWKEHVILSDEGLIQGCGIGPLNAANLTQPLLEEMNRMLTGDEILALVIAFLDDQTVCCTEKMAAEIVLFVQKEGPKLGCYLNLEKCLLWAPCRMFKIEPSPEDPRLPQLITIAKDEGFTIEGAKILGTYFGTKPFCERMARKWIDERVEPLLQKILSLKDTTAALSLLHHSGVASHMVYIQRTTPSHLISDALAHYGSLLRNALSQLAAENITEEMWRIAGLPWKEGGHQMRDPTLHAPAAHLASLLACREQVVKAWSPSLPHLEKMIAKSVALLNSNLSSAVTSVKVDSKSAFKQTDLSAKIDLSIMDKIIKESTERGVALHLAQRTRHGMAWKHSIAKASKDHLLRPDEAQIILKFSLGAKVLPTGCTCPFCGKKEMDPFGDHITSCADTGHIVHTHNAYRDLLLAWCRLAGIMVQKETTIILRDGSTYRCDLYLPAGIPGFTSLPVLLDVTFRSPFTQTGVKKASKWSGASAEAGEDYKNVHFLNVVTLAGYAFIPIGVETLGGIGDECAPFLNYVLTQLHYTLRKPFHEVAAHFWQSLSVLVQRMKSNRILRCLQLLQAQEKTKERK